MVRYRDKPFFVVDADHVLIVAVGAGNRRAVQLYSDNEEYIERVKRAADFRNQVDVIIPGLSIEAGWDTPLGIVAALHAAAPSRTGLLEAPQEVLDELTDLMHPPGTDENTVF